MAYGATATREIRSSDEASVIDLLVRLEHVTEFTTGGCRGGDRLIGITAYKRFPWAHHRVIVPANRSQVDDWWSAYPDIEVIEMPEGSTYRDRNIVIVDHTDELVVVASYPESDGHSVRSGTWQTVRIARAAGVTVRKPLILRDSVHFRDL